MAKVLKFDFTFEGNKITVDNAPTRKDDWIIVKEEAYMPDRSKFILEKFKKDYSEIPVESVDQIYALSSRSAVLNAWLAKANLEYATKEKVPTFYREYVDTDDFKTTSEIMTKLRKSNTSLAEEEAKLAEDYKTKLTALRKKYSDENEATIGDSKLARVMNLNSTSLPLSIQLAIENFTPGKEESAPNKSLYAREMLIRFKVSLLAYMKKNKDADINKVIESLQVK